MTNAQLLEFQARLGNGIITKVNTTLLDGTHNTDSVAIAVDSLVRRIVDSGSTLLILFQESQKHDWSVDGAAIVRTFYDASLQGLYIFHNPKQRASLAQRFIDFSIVERIKLMKLYDKQLTGVSKKLATSKKRAAGEPAIQAEFNRVCKLYGYDPKKLPINWYRGDLRTIAKSAGYEAEYEILQKQLSGLVHSSYLALRYMPRYKDYHLISLYWKFAFRVIDKVTEHFGIALEKAEKKLLANSRASALDV